MKRLTQALLSLCLTALLASCGSAETAADKAEQEQKDKSYSGDVKLSANPVAEGSMIDTTRSIGLTGDQTPSNITLFRDVITKDGSGAKTRCISAIPDDLIVAKVFCKGDRTKSVADIKAGQLQKYCVMLAEATPAVAELTLPCDDAKIAQMVTTPALFLGLR